MKSTAAKLSALIAVTDWGYGAGYARAWPYRYGTYGVWSGAPRTYTDVSNYPEGAMILDLMDTRTNKLVFRGAGRRRDPFPGAFFAASSTAYICA